MAKLPTSKILVRVLEHRDEIEPTRGYLGMSQLGHDCQRYLFYTLRDCYTRTITQKQKRIFERGELEEKRVINDLRAIGARVTHEQHQVVGLRGHVLGHIDGIVTNIPGLLPLPHLLEVKTMAEKYYKELLKKGLFNSNFAYYVQAQLYMHYTDCGYCLFVATNKNTEDRAYLVIEYDPGLVDRVIEKSRQILNLRTAPKKIGGPEWYKCKWCSAYDICHQNENVEPECRNCRYSVPVDGGNWRCEVDIPRRLINFTPCKYYEYIVKDD